jgi:hypothetical protein
MFLIGAFRSCPRIICASCSGHRAVLKHLGDSKASRVCDVCYEALANEVSEDMTRQGEGKGEGASASTQEGALRGPWGGRSCLSHTPLGSTCWPDRAPAC